MSFLCFQVGWRPNGPGVRNQSGSWSCHWGHQETSPQMDRGGGRGQIKLIEPVLWSPLIQKHPLVHTLNLRFQIQYEITRVRQKMKELALLHDKHMNRPTLDDSSEEEHAIEITTQEITQVNVFSIYLHARKWLVFLFKLKVWTKDIF